MVLMMTQGCFMFFLLFHYPLKSQTKIAAGDILIFYFHLSKKTKARFFT